MTYIFRYISPLGGITIAHNGTGLTGLWFDGQKYYGSTLDVPLDQCEDLTGNPDSLFLATAKWLDVYFEGIEPDFTPPLSLDSSYATDFRREVWDILLQTPYGHTITYGEIAKRIASKRGIATLSAQAVGGAVGHNPVSIIIPCHRVIGQNGSLTGYAGGLDRKIGLLAMEKADISKHI
ncbi:MAG: methylated-DNA--[protein]-cysteine S-methyltransferase [Clostridiales bacterium]|nr:methylated-DNA--[protein]-cysteine S-methyltransferase [Candidatus Crickella merdequi]